MLWESRAPPLSFSVSPVVLAWESSESHDFQIKNASTLPLLIWHSVFVTAHKHLLILIIIVSFYIFCVCLLLPLLFIVFYFCFLAHWMGWWCRFSFGRCFVSLFFGLASMCAEEWRKYNDDKERSDVRFCRSRRPVYEFSNKMKCALLNHCKTADP